jgi:hypothetical protein
MAIITVQSPKITILDQDVNMVDGLYSLNDVHRISGGEIRHAPSNFMRNKEVKELIDEIKCSANMQGKQVFSKLVSGKDRGTYACRDLVYRYAMWVSAKFALIVIHTFDAVVNDMVKTNGYQLGDLQRMSDEVDAEYAIGFSIASGGGKVMNNWKGEKLNLEGRKAAIKDLMQPLLTGFNETKLIK